MIPVLAAASCLMCAKSQALVHSALLLKWVIIAFAHAEAVAKVLVVLVARGWLLRVNPTLGIGRRIQAQGTGTGRWQTRGTAVACEVALGEDLDKLVFTVALHRAGVADARGIVRFGRVCGGRVASQAREHALSEGSEIFGAILDTL